MVKLADTLVLGTSSERIEGSSPSPDTIVKFKFDIFYYFHYDSFLLFHLSHFYFFSFLTMLSNFSLDLHKILDDLFLVLSEKERWVVSKRFALDQPSRWTLERVGQHFGVTRERIRQIEKIALAKLKRTIPTTPLKTVGELAIQILNQHGGVMNEDTLVEMILKPLSCPKDSGGFEASIVQLALTIHPTLVKIFKSDINFPYYALQSIVLSDVDSVLKKVLIFLEKKGDVASEAKLLSDVALLFSAEEKTFNPEFIRSVLSTDSRIKKIPEGYGLMTWRHVNPKSIRDKAFIVLKKTQQPLHFQEIAQRIAQTKFDHKNVTTQAVHNELIRYDQFVLVGRGLYALKEWGYSEGTVSEIIVGLLRKKSPLTKQEITSGVLRQRKVKKGTISLNLQKNDSFVRVGRALYALNG